ncbi:MAG: FAD:protein FMN transferase [Clostridia bacterium]|nr:FAD:protein FMN transferase [Clostridia bacterium]
MTKKIITSIILLVLIFGMIIFQHFNGDEKSIHQTYFYLGTIIDITLYGTDNPADLEPITELIHYYDNLFDRHNEKSDVYQLNALKSYEVHEETYHIIKTSLSYSEFSQGKFDITINPIVDLWQIGTENARIPEQREIDDALAHVGYKQVHLGDHHFVTLDDGCSIDLGAIAKGFIADEIAQTLKDNGFTRGLINLGGNVFALGQPKDTDNWIIGVKNPVLNQSNVLLSLALHDKSIVTSGITERYFIEDDILYHHIFDPRTGYPINNDILSITVITDTSFEGDALSTSLYTLGVEGAINAVKTLKDVSIIIVKKDKEILVSEAIKDKVELFDDSFTIKTIE